MVSIAILLSRHLNILVYRMPIPQEQSRFAHAKTLISVAGVAASAILHLRRLFIPAHRIQGNAGSIACPGDNVTHGCCHAQA